APAAIVRRLEQLFPQVRVVGETLDPASDEVLLGRIVDAQQLLATLANRLRRHRTGQAAGPLWWALYDWVVGYEQLRQRAQPLFKALNHHNGLPPLQRTIAAELFGVPLRGSVSRLESFS